MRIPNLLRLLFRLLISRSKLVLVLFMAIFHGFDTIKNLASVVWYFIISLFIVKDIAKRINKIKSGNIDDVCDSNIKEDIL